MTSNTTLQPCATPANRLCLDYREEAKKLGTPVAPIIDVHTHINGARAARIYKEARSLFGIKQTYSMTQLTETQAVSEALDNTIRYIAVPNYFDEDRKHAMTEGFLESIQGFHDAGARIVKFWCAPRRRDFAEDMGLEPKDLTLDNEWNIRAMELATSLGMMFMTHIADPDTWFIAKYSDAARYGTKRAQYTPLEQLLDRFTQPWIAAHMGGWPEDLDKLSNLLSKHPNLHLDTSATKWMVRELSKHPRAELVDFLTQWKGRILFGTDIVTLDAHLDTTEGPRNMGTQASTESEAFDLYASRHYALRTLLETSYTGESPIADPDLMMINPDSHNEMSAPELAGKSLPKDLLQSIYHDAPSNLLDRWHEAHP